MLDAGTADLISEQLIAPSTDLLVHTVNTADIGAAKPPYSWPGQQVGQNENKNIKNVISPVLSKVVIIRNIENFDNCPLISSNNVDLLSQLEWNENNHRLQSIQYNLRVDIKILEKF